MPIFYQELSFYILSLSAILYVVWGVLYKRKVEFSRADIIFSAWFILFVFLANWEYVGTYTALSMLFLCWALSKNQHFMFLIVILLLGWTYFVFTGMMEFFSSNSARISGSFPNPSIFADAILPFACGGLGVLFFEGGKKRFLGLFIFVVSIICIAFAQSRAAIFSILCAIIACFIIKYRTYFSLKKKIIFSIFSLLTIGCIIFYFYNLRTDSIKGRMLIYSVTSANILHHPLGHGLVSFRAHYMKCQANFFKENPDSEYAFLAGNTKTAFNELLQVGFELGWVGILLFIISVFYLFSIKSKGRYVVYALKIILIGMCISSMFSYPLRYPNVCIVWVIFIAILASFDDKHYSFSFGKRQKIALIISTLSFVYMFIHFQTKRYQAYNTWENINNGNICEIKDIVYSYNYCLPILENEPLFLLAYANDMQIIGKTKQSIGALNKMTSFFTTSDFYMSMGECYLSLGDISKAEECFITAHNMVPVKFAPLYSLMRMYHKLENYDKALNYADIIIRKRIKIHSEKIDIMVEEANELISQHHITH